MDEEKSTPNPDPNAESTKSTAPEPAEVFSLYRDPLDESADNLPKITVPKKPEADKKEKEESKDEDEQGASFETIETVRESDSSRKQNKFKKPLIVASIVMAIIGLAWLIIARNTENATGENATIYEVIGISSQRGTYEEGFFINTANGYKRYDEYCATTTISCEKRFSTVTLDEHGKSVNSVNELIELFQSKPNLIAQEYHLTGPKDGATSHGSARLFWRINDYIIETEINDLGPSNDSIAKNYNYDGSKLTLKISNPDFFFKNTLPQIKNDKKLTYTVYGTVDL